MRTARILTALAAALAAVLALASCQVLEFIFGSVFPATAALARAQVDLSGAISSSDGSAFKLRVVQIGGTGYEVLVGNLPAGITAYVYDQDLSLKGTFTGLTTDGVMADAGGQLIVGSKSVNPATMTVSAAVVPLSSFGNLGGTEGFFDAGSLQATGFGFTSGTSTLNWNIYNGAWGAAGSGAATLSAVLSDLRIESILDDGNPAGNATLVLSDASSQSNGSTATCYFVTTTKSNWTAGGSGLTNGLDSSPHLDAIDTGTIGFSQGSLVVYDAAAGRFLRVDPATGSIQDSLYSGQDVSSTRLAYLPAGGFFYGFDTKTRVLTKYAAWW